MVGKTLLPEAAGTGWWKEPRAYLPEVGGIVKVGSESVGEAVASGKGDTAQVECVVLPDEDP